MKYLYLPKASGTHDFVIIGSKGGFAAMVFIAAALAIITGIAIIKAIRKNKK